MKNFYPELPEVEYKKTTVGMPFVVLFAKTLIGKYPLEVVRMAYVIFRNESANGKSGVNNNYCGIQADNARWEGLDLTNVIGTSVKKDNFGDVRRFLCFNEKGYQACFEFLCYKFKQRGVYIGAENIEDSNKLALAYLTKWVGLSAKDAATKTEDITNFKSLYKSSNRNIIKDCFRFFRVFMVYW